MAERCAYIHQKGPQVSPDTGTREATGHRQSRNLPPSCAVLRSVAQSCPTLCDPMNCSAPGSSVHGDISNLSHAYCTLHSELTCVFFHMCVASDKPCLDFTISVSLLNPFFTEDKDRGPSSSCSTARINEAAPNKEMRPHEGPEKSSLGWSLWQRVLIPFRRPPPS